MGFLAKLFGKEAEAAITNISENVVKEASNVVSQISNEVNNLSNSSDSSQSAPQAVQAIATAATSCSWGDSMPSEPNQYNYQGSYIQYFESIFADKLGKYRMEKEDTKWGRTVYTFYSEAGKALVVELLPETSVAKKVRNDCVAAGVPYLRFYYNHKGWWNTRSYVEGRIAGAL